jgi:putative FmdB family regulatory protein
MPIYAYRCETCGHAKDVIQKFSDTPLSVCPSCGAETFRKQLSAPSFQLKGSGWYVTDFRDSGKSAGAKADAAKTDGEASKDGAAAATPAPAAAATATAAPAESAKPASGGSDAPAAPSKPTPTT